MQNAEVSRVRLAFSIVALLVGAFLVAGGVSVAVGDPYDSGRAAHVIVGLLYGVLACSLDSADGCSFALGRVLASK